MIETRNPPTHKELARFVEKYAIDPTSGCWLWTGTILIKGYGQFCRQGYEGKDGPRWQAHRFSYFVSNGPISHGLCVCHHCDVRSCVNPDHLFLGTNDDNVNDRNAKNRQAFLRGERNGRSKLTSDDVLFIRGSSLGARELGQKFGVDERHILAIRQRTFWRHI